ncbi:DUF1398 domain-containing protein [Alteraurantiacibacter buctensis]|uniref:DUF1398 domain-containing protein n=1 Tax=Alteraurantiacibacter buctensis TaxID=1503981 RepID=A0A844YXP3_9SPHN|nr:DUF1398 domain-containing protein [Alteraurantiacibacter buctensis]MXO73115.1 DUF1398 domain-containing protein [Alteraurantiacibacter buctensis]
MTPSQKHTAATCLAAAHDGSMAFPQIIGRLRAAEFEGYLVDYRAASQTFYLPSGEALTMPLDAYPGEVVATFDQEEIRRAIEWAQSGDPAYSFPAFSTRVKMAGCAGYIASFSGARVLYFGRTGDCHIEHFG